jgi:hypothetical protein
MTNPRVVVGIGALLGIGGAAGQLWLMQLGAAASAPLRAMLSMAIAILIGVIAGTMAKTDAIKVAALMGVVAGAILTLVGLGALLVDPRLIGQTPFASVESFMVFAGSILMGTAIASWIIAGVAVLVTWPLSLAQVREEE